MKNRPIYMSDIPVLQKAIDEDKFHPKGTWKVEDFKGFSEIFEDKYGTIVFVVYTPEGSRLRISTMWVTPYDSHRNGRCIIFLVRLAVKMAAGAGFKELIFSTTHDKLRDFCCKALGFVGIGNNEYRLPTEGKNG